MSYVVKVFRGSNPTVETLDAWGVIQCVAYAFSNPNWSQILVSGDDFFYDESLPESLADSLADEWDSSDGRFASGYDDTYVTMVYYGDGSKGTLEQMTPNDRWYVFRRLLEFIGPPFQTRNFAIVIEPTPGR